MDKVIKLIEKRVNSNKKDLKRLEKSFEEDDCYEDMHAVESTKCVIQELESLLKEVKELKK